MPRDQFALRYSCRHRRTVVCDLIETKAASADLVRRLGPLPKRLRDRVLGAIRLQEIRCVRRGCFREVFGILGQGVPAGTMIIRQWTSRSCVNPGGFTTVASYSGGDRFHEIAEALANRFILDRKIGPDQFARFRLARRA